MNSKEFKKARTNKYKRLNQISSIWDITKTMHQKGKNSTLWQSNKFEKHIQSVKKLEISAKVLKKHLPKKYIDLVRLGWEWEESIWIFFVKDSLISNKLNYLLDEISISIAKDIGYAPRIKIQVTPKNWQLSGVSLSDRKEQLKNIPTPEEADKFISEFVNRDD